MKLDKVLKILGVQSHKFELGTSYNSILRSLGQPVGMFEQRRHQVKVLKYPHLELTFVQNALESYSYVFSEGLLEWSYYQLERELSSTPVISEKSDYYVVNLEKEIDLVFLRRNDRLYKIMVNKSPTTD